MTTEELCANLKKSHGIVDAASNKLWAVSIDLPEDSEENVARLPIVATTAHDISETLEVMRYYLSTNERTNGRQISSEELKKICAIICKHLQLVRELVEDVLFDLTIPANEYHTDLWVLSTAIAEMIGKFQQKGDNEGQTV